MDFVRADIAAIKSRAESKAHGSIHGDGWELVMSMYVPFQLSVAAVHFW
jgi:hypothetical protein